MDIPNQIWKRAFRERLVNRNGFVARYAHAAHRASHVDTGADAGLEPGRAQVVPPDEPTGTTGLNLYLFGALRAYVDGQEVIGDNFTRRKVKAILAYLYLRRGQYISKDELLEALWPDVDDIGSSSGRLKQNILVLRHTLEGHKPARSGWRYILERGGSYFFNTHTPYYSDLEDFESSLDRAVSNQQHGESDAALVDYERALGLYRADLLQDFRYEDWAASPAAFARDRYLQALEQAARIHGARGDYAHAVQLLRRAIHEEPLRESSSIQLMEWFWRRGDHAEAMRVYLRLKTMLASTLQLEPKAEATGLYEAIRRDRAVGGGTPPGDLTAAS